MNKIIILVPLFILLILAGCEHADEINKEYPKINDRKHVFKSATPSDVIKILKGEYGQAEKSVVVLSFPACPWCQEALPRINQVAKEMNIDKVWLLNIREIRDQKTPEYLEIFDLVKDHIEFSGNAKEQLKINVPTIMVVGNGEIIASHLSTVSSHRVNGLGYLPPLDEDQEQEFLEILRALLNK